MRPVLVLLLSLASSGVAAQAGAPSDEVVAEAKRLKEQMQAYTERTAWSGVEWIFVQLEALDDAPLTLEDWFIGAQSARALGDAAACQRRLIAGFDQAEAGLSDGASMDPRAFQWLGELNQTYGRVLLIQKTEGTLQAVDPPFQSDRQAAIAFARTTLAGAGRFEGLLPAGEYTLGQARFTVEQGTDDRQKIKLK